MTATPSPESVRNDITPLFELAQNAKGLPWLLSRLNRTSPYLGNPQVTAFAMNISHFSNANLTMEVLDGNVVSFRYKFWDFQGTVAVPAGTEAYVQTYCREVNITSRDGVIPATLSNSTDYPIAGDAYRWIFVTSTNATGPNPGPVYRGRTELCMFGTSNLASCLFQ